MRLSGLSVQPKIIATTKREPARLPMKVRAQCCSILRMGKRRCSTAVPVYYSDSQSLKTIRETVKLRTERTMKEPVHRSAPVRIIIHNP